jgi:hypothetical protein
VLILLPPSEGKADPAAGDRPPLDLGALSFPELTPARAEAVEALTALCAGPDDTALAVLGLTAGQVGELARDRALAASPALPAAELYTGVLYDALGLGGLLADPATADRTRAAVVIFSGLWGVLRVDDPVPPYRLAMGVKLPPLGPLAGFWRPALRAALAEPSGGRLLVDMRSAPYAAAWRPEAAARERHVAVRVLRERRVRRKVTRSVVSHMAKATRGAVAGALLRTGAAPGTPKDLAEAVNDLGYRAELTEPPRPGASAVLDVIVTD